MGQDSEQSRHRARSARRAGERNGALEEAVTAHQAALQEYAYERLPLEWAANQYNLGRALLSLGQRESGTARLEAAVAAYRAALHERTRKRVPLDWAITEWGLGDALKALGQREGGTARLSEAVDAYESALAVFVSAGSVSRD
jgi:tetratricopeptide (TPR) repeat protein